jgi:D-threonate/D-erythronate kinase
MAWAVLADDFTGALDTGLQFARRGLDTVFHFGDRPGEAAALVLSSDSRALAPAEAAEAAAAAARAAGPGRRFYKKIDSTLRGNIAPELAAIMGATGIRKAILAPAYPGQHRTTLGGVQHIDGLPVTATELSRDPQSPVHEDDIVRLIATTSDLTPALLPLASLRAGIASAAAALAQLTARADVIVADAETDADLAALAGAVRELAGASPLVAGSAGFAEHLIADSESNETGAGAGFPLPHPPSAGIALIAGSFSAVTRGQVAAAAAALQLQPHIPSRDRYPDPHRALAAALAHLEQQPVWITHPGAGRRDLSPARVEQLSTWISSIATGLATAIPEIGLILTGGETASLAVRGLGATGIRIAAEVRPGIPGGLLVGGLADGRPVVTKAGAFGDPDALRDAVRWLQSA